MSLLEELKQLNQNTARDMQFNLAQIAKSTKADIEGELEVIIERKVKEAISQIRVRDGRDGKDGVGVDGRTPSRKELVSLIKAILPEEKSLDVENIKGLQDLLNALSNRISNVRVKKGGAKGGGGSTVRVDDLSSQADGSTKTFNTTFRIGLGLVLQSTQFPRAFRPTVDYTTAGTVLTLTSEVGAPATGQSLIFAYIEG